MSRVEHIAEGVTLYQGDCREILPGLGKVDAVVTDPPYPDYHRELYKYDADTVRFVLDWIGTKRALVFWSTKIDLECSPSAIHIWDKKTGCGSEYERIYELNGQRNFKVARHYLINSTVAASYSGDDFTGHPSQKPASLLKEIIGWLPGKTIADPFMGSGTTGVVAVNSGRHFVGVEIDAGYFDVACKRVSKAVRQQDLFIEKPKPAKQEALL